MSRPFVRGQKVTCPIVGDHAIVKSVKKSMFGGYLLLLTGDKTTVPVWVHQTQVEYKKGTSTHVIPKAQHESEPYTETKEGAHAA